ncbi:PQQ-dependent sugar dehydrogenase [Halotalea alkalilenta]|uniref:Oxidoreductase n=1 Tax=Halotalea alkalilenta TaxID=376489 RepID=A0A172YCG1_9GAMM|nr:PQQ-dependent sugar dehydrogenase [Halotalea alkalilenta]ANF56806.1 oxidoreductase [Halotalea alkalilenta]
MLRFPCALALLLCAAPSLALTPPEGADSSEYPSERGTLRVTSIVEGLERPWALAFLPDGRALVSEKPGRLRLVSDAGELSAPLEGLPEVWAQRQGGLLDIAVPPDFEHDPWIYFTYAEAGDDGRAGTALARARLEGERLNGVEVLFRQADKLSTGNHFGSRIVFADDGTLFVALGENNQRPTAQRLDLHQGKVVRLNRDGSVPTDNPFVGDDDALDEIWSYGHRNPQGAALHPDSRALWVNEHGPRGGDEINLPQPGANYGWPLATHGIDYSGQSIAEAQGAEVEGTEPPDYVWEISPGVSGMAFATDERLGEWQGDLFIGALATEELIRLELDGDRVSHEERLLAGRGERIRDVRQGPDGALYLLTDHDDGKLLKLELLD